jgi:hypothetical protein
MNSYTNTVTYANGSQQGNNIGISAQGGDYIKMINNISVVDASWNGFALSASSGINNLVVKNNLIYGVNGTLNQDTDITNVHSGTVEADPKFVDALFNNHSISYDFDFHLQSNSPAKDTASPAEAPSVDFYGNLRSDGNPDRGAIEYLPTNDLQDNTALNMYSVYPSPSFGKVYIKSNKPIQSILLFSFTGRKINFTLNPNDNSINLKGLEKGLYFININGTTKKLILK